ncbi:hypothetical protein AB0I53_44095 [Saccharopolyspora sp. NPDC050389]|uniref:hypothetical protein n=1 Tax=Saccharopolyspora sp. NPDC050389 TaxID=3155516 RepID=UPI0033DF110B
MFLARLRHHTTTAGMLLLAIWVALAGHLTRDRERAARFDDEGSESTEKAVLTAIGLTIALGLGAAITAVVSKYQGQLH